MNSEQKELLARASRMESIEAFQRDVEPAIIAARDQLMTRENYRGYYRNDVITRNNVDDHVLYAFISRSYDFDEHDPVRVRDVFDAALAPLGFVCSEKADVLQDGCDRPRHGVRELADVRQLLHGSPVQRRVRG